MSDDCRVVEVQNERVTFNDNYFEQILARLRVECEICFLQQREQNEDNNLIINNNDNNNKLFMLPCKVTGPKENFEEDVQRNAFQSKMILCQKHKEELQQQEYWEQFKTITQIHTLEIPLAYFRQAREIKVPQCDLDSALIIISQCFCCKTIRQRYLNTFKELQYLRHSKPNELIEFISLLKIQQLKLTQLKFEMYYKYSNQLTQKQKFLALKWYQRIQKQQQFNPQLDKLFEGNEVNIEPILPSQSIYFDLEYN